MNIGSNWTNAYPDLVAVSAVSATDAWAVGAYGNLLHDTAGTWTDGTPCTLSFSDVQPADYFYTPV